MKAEGQERIECRLAAILAADVPGYARLMRPADRRNDRDLPARRWALTLIGRCPGSLLHLAALKGRQNEMKLPQTGGCQCGALRYEITEAPQMVYTCHCTDCQRLTSSAFSMAVVVTAAAFRLTIGEPRSLQKTADSGRMTTRWVCPQCGSWICSAPTGSTLRVRAGTLDDTSWLRPTAHFWTRSRQPWIALPEGRPDLRDAARGSASVPLLD
jgi:hypothetical protein